MEVKGFLGINPGIMMVSRLTKIIAGSLLTAVSILGTVKGIDKKIEFENAPIRKEYISSLKQTKNLRNQLSKIQGRDLYDPMRRKEYKALKERLQKIREDEKYQDIQKAHEDGGYFRYAEDVLIIKYPDAFKYKALEGLLYSSNGLDLPEGIFSELKRLSSVKDINMKWKRLEEEWDKNIDSGYKWFIYGYGGRFLAGISIIYTVLQTIRLREEIRRKNES